MNQNPSGVRPELASMVAYEPGKPTDELKREYGLEGDVVKLASNENPFPPPEALRRVYEGTFDSLNRYPDGGCYYLKEALSEQYDWPREGIVVGGGSDEVLDCLGKAMLTPQSEVLTAQPAFIRYRMVAQMMGARPVEVPLTDSLDLNLERMLESVTPETDWICLPNPNNPTSRYCSDQQLGEFLEALPAGPVVILDEAYFELMAADDYPDGTEWLTGEKPTEADVIVLRTFSKAYGLAGLRVGYGLMDPALAREIDKIRPPFNVTKPAQAVAREALKHSEFLERTRKQIMNERHRLCDELTSRGFKIIPPSANFMLVEPPSNSAKQWCEELKKRGIIVRPMSPYGLESYFRLTVGTAEENTQFLSALEDIDA